jgi:AcrR family transcriptional regulator
MDTGGDTPTRLPSGKHDLPPDLVAQSQRDRIMLGVAETVKERGYAKTTVAEICARAGVSTATFYELFRDRDDCLMAAANSLLGEIVALVSSRLSPDKPIHQMVRDALAAVLTLMAQRPAFAHLIFVEGRTLTPAVRQVYNSGVSVLLSLIDQTRVDGPADAPTPAIAARAACGAMGMVIRYEILCGRTEQLAELLPEAMYSFLVPFLGQEQALALAEEARANPPRIDLAPYGRAHF